MKLRGSPIAVLDTETTSADPAEARIVEIAVVVVDRLGEGAPSVELHTRINPGAPIPPDASKVHGITDADVAGAPSWGEVWPYVRDLVGPRLPCAYNAPYDSQVLTGECDRIGVDAAPVAWGRWLDPFVLVRSVDKFKKGKRLIDAASRRGIEVDAHGAAGDAMTTALLLPRLIRESLNHKPCNFVPAHVESLDAYLTWQFSMALEQERDLVAFLGDRECPWHVLSGRQPPMGRPATTGTPCSTCRALVLLSVGRDGSSETLNASDRSPHACAS